MTSAGSWRGFATPAAGCGVGTGWAKAGVAALAAAGFSGATGAGKGAGFAGAGVASGVATAGGVMGAGVTVGVACGAGASGFVVGGGGASGSSAGKTNRRGSIFNAGKLASAQTALTHSAPANREINASGVRRARECIMVLSDGKGAKIA